MPHTHTSNPSNPSPIHLQAALDELVQILQQPGPPSLRELLEAYSQKGNGDRELLLAMLSAKSSEDQRVAAVIQSHQTLIQAHAVVQSQQQQQQKQQQQAPQSSSSSSGSRYHQTGGLLSVTPSHVIAPPSPSGTSQSHSSTSSPRLQTMLPPLHSHLAELRRVPNGGQNVNKRRRMEREVTMIESGTTSERRSGRRRSRSGSGSGSEERYLAVPVSGRRHEQESSSLAEVTRPGSRA